MPKYCLNNIERTWQILQSMRFTAHFSESWYAQYAGYEKISDISGVDLLLMWVCDNSWFRTAFRYLVFVNCCHILSQQQGAPLHFKWQEMLTQLLKKLSMWDKIDTSKLWIPWFVKTAIRCSKTSAFTTVSIMSTAKTKATHVNQH